MIRFACSTAVVAILLSAPAMAQTAAPASGPVQYVQSQSEGQWLASNVMGETVRGPNDETIGDINNLVVDRDGKVMAAVIGVGGFLGIGEKDVAVPFSALQLSNEPDGKITLAATKDELKNAPEFKDLDDQDMDNRASQVGTPGVMPATNPPGAGPAMSAPAMSAPAMSAPGTSGPAMSAPAQPAQ